MKGNDLTKRERQVANMIVSGEANKKIADELSISLGTVKNHIRNIYRKMDVHNERQFFKKYYEKSTMVPFQ